MPADASDNEGVASKRLLHDVRKLVNPGLVRACRGDDLIALPSLEIVKARTAGVSNHAIVEAIRSVVLKATTTLGPNSAGALGNLLALDASPPTVETRQQRAAESLGLQSGQGFKAHRQGELIAELVEALLYLEERGDSENAGSMPALLEWQTLQTAIVRLHAKIDREYAPELVITMSGPGSFAACYFLSLGSRDVPLLTCTTFPARDRKLPAHETFATAASGAGWLVLEPHKWNVYVPNVVERLPQGYRVLLLDDRVITGGSQRTLKSDLTQRLSLEVRCAAVITHSMSTQLLDWYGMIIDDDYTMPWGARRGRE